MTAKLAGLKQFLLRRRASKVRYTTTSTGFRYRMLDVSHEKGYLAAVALLLPGESLYRVHYDELPRDRPFLVLVNSVEDFEWCERMFANFDLAAGIPVVSSGPGHPR